MGTPFLSEIRIISFNFPPTGWAFCNGQTLAINQNQALFSLIGTTYGGDGINTFKLPNLQGNVPIMQGENYVLGATVGEVNHTLVLSEIPSHSHTLLAVNTAANVANPSNAALAQPSADIGALYAAAGSPTTLAPQAIANTGGSQPHSNQQPYLVLNYVIALVGIFPSRN